MPIYTIECIEQEANNAIIGAKPCDEVSQDVTYFSGIRITRSALVNGGSPVVTDLAAPVYYEIDGNVVTLRGSSSSNDQYYTLPLDSADLDADAIKALLDDCNCCGEGGGDDDFVVSGVVAGNDLTLTLDSGATVVIDVNTLVNTDDFVVSGVVAGNDLTLTLDGGGTVVIDVSSLVGGAGDDWGTQVVVSDGTLSGDGTAGSPLSVVSSTGLSVYDAGLGFWVKGTAGITVTSGSQGVYDFDIPTGGILESFTKQFTNAGTDYTVGGEAILNIDWNTGAFNTSFADAILPDLRLYDPAGTQREPGAVSVTAQTTAVAAGATATTVANINGLGVPVNLKGVF